MAGAADYLLQLQALLPQGAAWPRESLAVLTKLLNGLAEEFARADARGLALLEEADPRTTSELLADWETAFGLPDDCALPDSDPVSRRITLHQRVAGVGGQSVTYFVGLAAAMGYEVEIDEPKPLRIPFSIPATVAGRQWAFAWRVEVYGPLDWTDPDPVYASANLECVIRRIRPGHTVVSFDYSPDPDPVLHFDFLNP